MKKQLLTTFKIVFTVLSSFLLQKTLFSQNIENSLAFANEQYTSQNYETAIHAYQRVIFFEHDNEILSDVYSRTADCYDKLDNTQFTLYYYDLAYNTARDDSIKNELIFKKTLCLLQKKEFNPALSELLSLNDSLSCYFNIKKDFYLGVTYFGLSNYELSGKHIVHLLQNEEEKKKANLLFKKIKKLKRINPKTAKLLSMILPGLGQFYIGDIKNGINSFLLTTGFLFLGIHTASAYSILDAVIAVMPWYQRYYTGGYKKAELNANKRAAHKKNKYFHEILNICSHY